MGRKAKQCLAKKGRREEKVPAPAPAPAADQGASSSSDGEGGSTGTTGRLPMANLVRLMRQVLPDGVNISSRAKDLTHDCAVEFVGFLASEAVERARAEHRRTIAPEDFVSSLQALGFDDFVKPMTTYTSRYRGQVDPAGNPGFECRPPPPPATVMAAVTAAPCVSDEEMQRRVPSQHEEDDDGGSTSVQAHFT